jgi:hypothetical protein
MQIYKETGNCGKAGMGDFRHGLATKEGCQLRYLPHEIYRNPKYNIPIFQYICDFK